VIFNYNRNVGEGARRTPGEKTQPGALAPGLSQNQIFYSSLPTHHKGSFATASRLNSGEEAIERMRD